MLAQRDEIGPPADATGDLAREWLSASDALDGCDGRVGRDTNRRGGLRRELRRIEAALGGAAFAGVARPGDDGCRAVVVPGVGVVVVQRTSDGSRGGSLAVRLVPFDGCGRAVTGKP